MSDSIRYPLHVPPTGSGLLSCASPMMLPEQVRKTGAGKLYCIRCARLVDVTPEQRGQAERAALADGFDVLAHRAPSPVVAPPPSPLPDLAMLVPAEPRKGGAAKLTPARRRALEAAAKHHEGRWYPEGSGQCQMAREMAELGFGEYRHSGGGAGFTIGAKGRAVLRG